MLQLIFTSTPKGLIQGRSGFSTVAMTHGFPTNLIPIVENLSAYERLYAAEDVHADRNPVNYRFARQRLGSQEYGVLSKIEFSGPGYSRRGTPIASHLLFTPDELEMLPGSMAQILRCAENFKWSGQVEELPIGHRLHYADVASRDGVTWQRLLGDGRWARCLAWRFQHERKKPVFLSFDPLTISSEELLSLMDEVSIWLTPAERMEFTFTTYCYQSSLSSSAYIRAYPINSPFLGSIRRFSGDAILTVGTPMALPESYQQMLASMNAEPETEFQPVETVVLKPCSLPPEEFTSVEQQEPPRRRTVSKTPKPDLFVAKAPQVKQTIEPEEQGVPTWALTLIGVLIGAMILGVLLLILGVGRRQQDSDIPAVSPTALSVRADAEEKISSTIEQKTEVNSQESGELSDSDAGGDNMADEAMEVIEKQDAPPVAEKENQPDAEPQKEDVALPEKKEDVPKTPTATKAQMDAFVQAVSNSQEGAAVPPAGWLAFVQSHWGDIKQETKSPNGLPILKCTFKPSPYLIACWNSNLIEKISIQLYGNHNVNFQVGGSLTWNKAGMKLNIPWDSLVEKVTGYNKQILNLEKQKVAFGGKWNKQISEKEKEYTEATNERKDEKEKESTLEKEYGSFLDNIKKTDNPETAQNLLQNMANKVKPFKKKKDKKKANRVIAQVIEDFTHENKDCDCWGCYEKDLRTVVNKHKEVVDLRNTIKDAMAKISKELAKHYEENLQKLEAIKLVELQDDCKQQATVTITAKATAKTIP